MSAKKQLDLAGTAAGRVMLHLLALNTDWKLSWHLAGILRELRSGCFLRAEWLTEPS